MPADICISVLGRDGQGGGASRLKGMIDTIDVSLGGFSARITASPSDAERIFGPALAYALVGKEVLVTLGSTDIMVWGKVVRVEPKTMIMAVIITRVSDIDVWKDLCSGEYGTK